MELADDTGTNPWVIVAVAFVAGLMGMGVVKLLGYLRKRDADKEAKLIIDRAEMEATSRRKEAEYEAKEMALRAKRPKSRSSSRIPPKNLRT